MYLFGLVVSMLSMSAVCGITALQGDLSLIYLSLVLFILNLASATQVYILNLASATQVYILNLASATQVYILNLASAIQVYILNLAHYLFIIILSRIFLLTV